MKAPFDETDAPPGYRAVDNPTGNCNGCALYAAGEHPRDRCSNPFKKGGIAFDPHNPNRFRCLAYNRADGRFVLFVRGLYGNEEES